MKNTHFLNLLLGLTVFTLQPVFGQHEAGETTPQSGAEFIRLGDVLMRSLNPWTANASNGHDTLKTAQDFRADRILWIYENTQAFNQKVREAGIGIGTTMAGNARERWRNTLSTPAQKELVERYTIRDLHGEQVIPTHMRKFGANAPIIHFQPDQTIPEWVDYYTDYLAGLYATGIDTIHRDDPEVCTSAARCGGTFTDSSVAYFRDFLKENYTTDELRSLGVNNIATFNVRDHFLALGAPVDDTLWQWRGSPLMPIYLQAMQQADRDFFIAVREKVEAQTGKKIPWSSNAIGPISPVEKAFDFRIGEFQAHFNQPQTMLILSEYARKDGKIQGLISMVDQGYQTNPDFVPATRRHIATAYASGMIPLVPWCMYMHSAPRYYGTTEDYADLYHFVADNRHLFDEHQLQSASGIDRTARLYTWNPNRELTFAEGNPASRVWLNNPNQFAFLRQKPDAKDTATIHLTDWNRTPESITITLSPQQIVGSETADLTLLRPQQEPLTITAYRGETIELPAVVPWGILLVTASETTDQTLAAPQINAPHRSIVPRGQPVTFAQPQGNHVLMARLLPADGATAPRFSRVQNNTFPIEQSGTLEAYTLNPANMQQSLPIAVSFESYEDFSAEPPQMKRGQDISARFTPQSGLMKVNDSFLTDKVNLMGKPVERYVATQGDATVSARLPAHAEYFTVLAGIDDAEQRRPSGRFQVFFDNTLAYETEIVNPAKWQIVESERRAFPISLRIPKGAKSVQLRAINNGFFKDQNNFIWADPTVY